MGAPEGLRSEADLAGDDEGAQVAFREVVVGRDAPVAGPVEQAGVFLAEDILKGLNGRMPGRGANAGADVALDALGLLAEDPVRTGIARACMAAANRGARGSTKEWICRLSGNSMAISFRSRNRCA